MSQKDGVLATTRLLKDTSLSSTAKVVYLKLRYKQEQSHHDPDTPLSVRQIAADCGLGVTAVTAALQQLEAAGWISMPRLAAQGGRFTSRVVNVHDEPAGT